MRNGVKSCLYRPKSRFVFVLTKVYSTTFSGGVTHEFC